MIEIENIKRLISCKKLKIVLKRHPSIKNYKKPENSYRIIVIGGSTTAAYGWQEKGVREWQAYPYVLQKYFDSIWPGKVDVINLGVIGGQLNDFLRSESFYLSLEPDMAIIAPALPKKKR